MNYEEFLERKKIVPIIAGFDVELDDLNSNLFDFQRVIVKWALKRGRAAIFADTGLGKTLMQTSWAQSVVDHTDGDVLIVAPLCVAQQTVREGEKFGISINFCRDQENAKPGINITNYEMLDRFNLDDFHGVVLDECFTPDTPIDVLSIDGSKITKYIKDIRKGDKIINASGVDIVSDVHRREIKYAIKINFNGRSIISSPNHPYFTQRGWVGASNLRAGDHLLETESAVRLVQNSIYPKGLFKENSPILRDILLSEMANEPAGEFGENSQSRCSSETREIKIKMAEIGRSESKNSDRTDTQFESYVINGNKDESLPEIEIHEASTFRAWGKRSWFNNASADSKGCVISELDSGICFVTGETSSGIPDMLQAGFSLSTTENRDRSGWRIAPEQERPRQEKGCETCFVGVDSLEVLEQGHPELEKYRNAEGKLYFYDIGATWHPSFSIHGVLVHNSSIIKNRDGKTRNALIAACQSVPYRLSCTATPSPNDFMELGNQSEFLGIMNMAEMLAMFFINDAGDTGTWILKGHGKSKFWEWLSTWACVIRSPTDLGFDGSAYILPKLNMFEHVVESKSTDGLFADIAAGLMERNAARKESIDDRVAKCAEVVNASTEQWVIWCHRNEEAEKLVAAIPGAVDVSGSDSIEHKENSVHDFLDNEIRVLVSKPKILGAGMNFQNCHNTAFVGLSDSWEQYYQAIRRFYRFGQMYEVNVHVISAESEGAVVANIKRKEEQNAQMGAEMVKHMSESMKKEIFGAGQEKTEYVRQVTETKNWTIHNADCIDLAKEIPDNSVDFTIYSPPFESLFTYSNSDRDMGNNKSSDDFRLHYQFLIDQNYRMMRPGRLVAVHCMNLTTSKANDGFIGIRDFRGDIIRAHQKAGFIYHSEVCIWKDPVVAMQRTKALGLLHKTIKKDSSMSRQGLADYLVIFRKPGVNDKPISHTAEEFPVQMWQRYASPVWFDIDQSRTLNFRDAREEDDVKHICPLQLDVIERAMDLWTAPDDLVFSPFTGVGSEGYTAVKMGRRFIGSELKPSYYEQAVKNMADAKSRNMDLFADDDAA